MSDTFVTAMTKAANDRTKWPMLVPCRRITGPMRGWPCGGHPDCRAAYWQRIDDLTAAARAETAAKAERERIEMGSLRPKRRIRP